MSQVYERVYGRINNSSQVTIVTDGNFYLLKIPFPQFGFLTKTLAQQVAGTGVAFKVDILNSGLGIATGEITPGTLPAGWQQYRVVNTLAGTAGTQAQGFTPAGNPWRNFDGADPTRSGVNAAGLGAGGAAGKGSAFTNAQRFVYALIQPSSGTGGNSTWEVAVNAFTETGG